MTIQVVRPIDADLFIDLFKIESGQAWVWDWEPQSWVLIGDVIELTEEWRDLRDIDGPFSRRLVSVWENEG